MRSSSLSKTCSILTCITVLSFEMTDTYGMGPDDLLDERWTPTRRSISVPATPECALAVAKGAMEERENSQDEVKRDSYLSIASTCYAIAIELWTEEEGRAKLLFDAANVAFLLWEKEPSEYKEKETSQLFAQALEAYREQISGYQLQMAAGFYLNVFKKDQTKFEHLKRGTGLMLRGINALGADTSPTSLMIGALYHFRLWKLDRTQTDILNTTIALYNRAVQAFGENLPPKLIELKQRIREACGCDVFEDKPLFLI